MLLRHYEDLPAVLIFLLLFHGGGRYHIETSPLICRANDNGLRHERVKKLLVLYWFYQEIVSGQKYSNHASILVAWRCSVKKGFLEISQNSQERLCQRCFPVNFAKFLRTPFLKEHFRWLLLYYIHKTELLPCKPNIILIYYRKSLNSNFLVTTSIQ